MNPTTAPQAAGWYWWRQHRADVWTALHVRASRDRGGALYTDTDDDVRYQADGDPQNPWNGEWWPEPIEPPPA